MELIAEIHDEDIGFENSMEDKGYRVRKASRAVIFNEQNQIALLFVSKSNYHKLPGGGLEEGEDTAEALKREAVEEAGVEIDVTGEVGVIIEYRDQFEQLQISYCFLAKVKSSFKNTNFTEDELSLGFQLQWVDIEDALQLLKNDTSKDYVGRFIQRRDLMFLLKAKQLLGV